MVMNKKGFLKILESIIAIIIVLGFVITIVPSAQKLNSKIPPDLEQTTNSILDEMRNKPEFRQCVLGGSKDGKVGSECVNAQIDYLSSPEASHPWEYAIKITTFYDSQTRIKCDFYNDEISPNPRLMNNDDLTCTSHDTTFNNALPTNTDVYIRSVVLTVPDVSGKDSAVVVTSGSSTVLTIFAWLKQ